MKKIILAILLLCFPAFVYGAEWDQGDLHALSAVLADGENGRVLYGEKEEDFRSIASTTKIMTAVIALEYGDPEQICEVSSYAASMPSVKLGIRKGEQYYLKDLLYAVMLESSNDAAVAVAEAVSGSVEKFAKKMNEKAREIGAARSNFVTPNGLDAKGQGSTAKDLAKIAAYAIKNEKFCNLINTRNHTFTSLSGKRTFSVTNKNAFLDQMDGAFGIKTGYTGEAGYCFVGALKDGDRTLISVVLGSSWPPNKNAKWQDTRKLMNFGLEHFQKKMISEKDSFQKMVAVRNGTRDFVRAKGGEDYACLLGDEKISIAYQGEFEKNAPFPSGESVGHVQIYLDGQMVSEQKLVTENAAAQEDGWICYWNVFWRFLSFQGIF